MLQRCLNFNMLNDQIRMIQEFLDGCVIYSDMQAVHQGMVRLYGQGHLQSSTFFEELAPGEARY